MAVENARFIRKYELKFTLDNEEILVKPPIRISFDCEKATEGGMNKINLSVYNLKKTTSLKLFKDRNQKKLIDLELKVGYENINLKSIYKGTIHYASTNRQSADLVTSIEGIDGGYDTLNAEPLNQNIIGKSNIIDFIVNNSERLQKGKISLLDNLVRPKMCLGSKYDVLNDIRDSTDNSSFFIDNEKINYLKKNQVVSSFIPIINASSGLLSTPQKQSNVVTFDCLLNTDLRLAGLLELQSSVEANLDGIYKISRIRYSGDNRSNNWNMQIECFLNTNFKVI